MTQMKRTAPDPEWVPMYRQGIPTPKIAAVAGVAKTTVRSHLAIAATPDTRIRAERQAALPAALPRLAAAGRRNTEDIIAFYKTEGRLPIFSRSAREKGLAVWLHLRRKETAQGTISPAYADALGVIPDWRKPRQIRLTTKRAGRSAFLRSLSTGLPATIGLGTTKPTTR